MAKPGGLTHILVELSTLDELSSLLGRSARLKFTCFCVSKKYIALGSNTGGVYIFSRDSQKYLQVVFGDTSSNPVVCVSLSPNDQFVGLALSTGLVAVFELNIEKRAKPERVRHTQDHAGHQVTAFTWDSLCSKMFVGDDIGKVSIVFVPLSKGQTLFSVPSEVIAYLECSVYQMEWWKDKLLVSTVAHTHLFDTTKHNFSTIGTKTRDGEFGSCFFLEPTSKCTVIYCARPGSRMWEVDFEGKVLNTHQFKQLLAIQPIPVVQVWKDSFDIQTKSSCPPQSANFFKMFCIGQFIVTWSSKGLYFFDPINVKVLIWTQSFKDIKDMAVYNNNVYLFLDNSSVHKLTLLPIYQLFTVLASRRHWSLMASLLVSADQMNMRPAIVKKVKQDLLHSLFAGLRESGTTQLIEKVRSVMEDVSEGSIDSLGAGEDFMDSSEFMGHTYLPSGMVVVSEGVQIKEEVRKIIEDSHLGVKGLDSVSLVGVENVCSTGGDGGINAELTDASLGSEKNEIGGNELTESDKAHGKTDGEENGPVVSLTLIRKEDEKKNSLSGGEGNLSTEESADIHLVTDKHCTNVIDENNSYSRLDKLRSDNSMDSEDPSIPPGHQLDNNNRQDADKIVNRDVVEKEISDSYQTSLGSERSIFNLDQNENLKNSADKSSDKGIYQGNNDLSLEEKTFIPYHLINGNSQQKNGEFMINTDISALADVDGAGLSLLSNTTLPVVTGKEERENELSRDNNIQGENIGVDSFTLGIGPVSVQVSDRISVDNVEDLRENIPITSTQDVHSPNKATSTWFQESDNAPQQAFVSDPSCAADDNQAIENCHETSKGNIKTKPESPTFSSQQPSSATVSSIDHEVIKEVPVSSDKDILNTNVIKKTKNANTSDELKSEVGGNEEIHPSIKFSPLDFSQSKDTEIAKPLKKSKKKRHKKLSSGSSHEVHIASLPNATTILEDTTEPVEEFKRRDYDSVSIGTISSIEEERETIHSGERTPDSISITEDTENVFSTSLMTSFSVSPPSRREFSPSRKSSVSSFFEENKTQVIPPLKDRLAAARGSVTSEDGMFGREDSPIHSPLTTSGEYGQMATSPRSSLSSIRDGLSMKLKTQTKSLIKSFKEKNPLLTKSSSSPMLAALPDHQQKQWKEDPNIQHLDGDQLSQSPEILPSSQSSHEKEAAAVVNISSLCFKAVSIQKKLNNASVLLNPKSLQEILNEWARELCEALVQYHEELLKREKERLTGENEQQERGENNKDGDTGIELELVHEKDKIKIGVESQQFKSRNISDELRKDSFGNEFQATATNDGSSISVNDSVPSQSAFTGSKEPAVQCLNASYWSNISHTHDPFHLSHKQMDIIETLTTMCFTCGATGNILDFFKFSEENQGREFLKAILSPSVFSCYNPGNDRLVSLFPENLRKDHMESVNVKQNVVRENNPECRKESGGKLKKELASNTENHWSMSNSQISSTVFPNEKIQDGSSSLESRVFCSSTETTNFNSETFHRNNEIPKIVNSEGLSDEEKKSSICLQKQMATQNLNDREVWEDLSLALFTRLFFFALDYELVKQTLDNHENKLFLTWNAVLQCSQEKGKGDIVSSILADKQIKSAIDYLRSGILPHQSAFLGHVCQLFDQVPFKTSEFCGEMKKAVTVIDLIRISAVCCKSVWTFLLKYVKQVMIDLATVQRPAAFKQLIKNRDVRILLLEALLPAEMTYSSVETSKSLTSNVIAVLPFDWLNTILSMVESDEEREEIVQLSVQIGHWQVCIKLLTEVDQWQRLLQLIVATSDITLLKGQHGEDAYIPRTVEEWKYLLQCFQEKNSKSCSHLPQTKKTVNESSNLLKLEQHSSSEDSNSSLDLEFQKTMGNGEQHYESFQGNSPKEDAVQDTAMTWSSLGYLLLRHLGGASTIELLMDHLNDPLVATKCLSTDFLNACYVDFSMRMEQDHITHEMLEKISMYMWAKKPGFVPPSVYHAVKTEKNVLENNTGEDVTLQGVFSQIKSTESHDLMAEYLGGHWGQEVNISSSCLACNVPLKCVMSLSSQGVIIFPCGHAFHKCCVPGAACPLIH